MKKNAYHNLLSSYLDGEIGLEDKRAFEDALRSDSQLRAEYHAQRSLGLALGSSLPEVTVHPYRFRQRLSAAIDRRSPVFITPQRAFTAAMAVALVVVSITFGLFIYQERMIGNGGDFVLSEAESLPARQTRPVHYTATLVVEATPESFYNRVLVETQVGMLDPALSARLLQQTAVLEGATCVDGLGLNAVVFPQRLPARASIRLSLAELQRFQAVADGLTSRANALALTSSEGRLITQQDYLLSYPSGAALPVELIFQQ